MSQTRSVTEYNVRLLIDDLKKSSYAISSVRMAQIIQGQMHLIGQQTFLPMESVTAVALVAGTADYTLTGVVADLRQVVRNSDGYVLSKATLDDLVNIYAQDSSGVTQTQSKPVYYALFETSAQASKIRFAPTPDGTDSVDVYYGIIPAALTSDSSTIPFSAPLLRGLEHACAAECVAMMSQDERARRMVSPEAVGLWREMSLQAIREENMRLRFLGSGTQAEVIEIDR